MRITLKEKEQREKEKLQKIMFKAVEKYLQSLGKNKKELKSKINYIQIEKTDKQIKLIFNVKQIVLGVEKTKNCILTLNYDVFQHIENKVFALFSSYEVINKNNIIEFPKLTKYNKSEIMKEAHRRAKTYEGDYRACLSGALKEIYKKIKEYNNLKEVA